MAISLLFGAAGVNGLITSRDAAAPNETPAAPATARVAVIPFTTTGQNLDIPSLWSEADPDVPPNVRARAAV